MNGLFMFYLFEAVPILLILPLLPRHCAQETDEITAVTEADISIDKTKIPETLPRLCLVAVFSFYLLVGAYWAFIERAGVAAASTHQRADAEAASTHSCLMPVCTSCIS